MKCEAGHDLVLFAKHVLHYNLDIRELGLYVSPDLLDPFNARFLPWPRMVVDKVRAQ